MQSRQLRGEGVGQIHIFAYKGKEWTHPNLNREFSISSNKCRRNSLQDSVFIIGFMRGQSSLYSTKGNTYIIKKWGMRNQFFYYRGGRSKNEKNI